MKTFFKKNLLLRAAACGFVLTVLLSFTGFSAQCDALEKNVIRLHVLANSDSDADQAVKLKVRDAVLLEAGRWYGDADDFETALAAVCTHLESLEAAANAVLRAEGVPYSAQAEVCEMYFPPVLTIPAVCPPESTARCASRSVRQRGRTGGASSFLRSACRARATPATCPRARSRSSPMRSASR